MSILNSRFRRWAQDMAARRSDAVFTAFPGESRALPPGVTRARSVLYIQTIGGSIHERGFRFNIDLPGTCAVTCYRNCKVLWAVE